MKGCRGVGMVGFKTWLRIDRCSRKHWWGKTRTRIL